MTAATPPNPYSSPAPQPQPQNTLGLVGFVLSLAGFACALTFPLGLIISLMGLRKEPKVFAIIGSVIGGLGTLGLLVVVVIYGSVVVACIGFGAALQPIIETETALMEAKMKIKGAQKDGVYPSQAEGDALIQGIDDYWKGQIRYEPRDGGFLVRSAGADRNFNTEDDLTQDSSIDDPTLETPEIEGGELMPSESTPPTIEPGIDGVEQKLPEGVELPDK